MPERFTLKIINEISPAANTALEGLYQSGDALCTQCEAEGFRHITYYLDRPDVLARFTTKILPIKSNIPSCFPMVTALRKANSKTDTIGYSGRTRSRNRATCLRWWQVTLMYCAIPYDAFWSRSSTGAVRDRGNLDRAPWAMTSLKISMKWDEERFGLSMTSTSI